MRRARGRPRRIGRRDVFVICASLAVVLFVLLSALDSRDPDVAPALALKFPLEPSELPEEELLKSAPLTPSRLKNNILESNNSNWIEAVPNASGDAMRTSSWFKAKVNAREKSWRPISWERAERAGEERSVAGVGEEDVGGRGGGGGGGEGDSDQGFLWTGMVGRRASEIVRVGWRDAVFELVGVGVNMSTYI